MERAMRSAFRWNVSRFGAFSRHWRFLSSDSAPLKPGEIGEVSGVPENHLRRPVYIYSPARTASQQGSARTGKWKINFLSTEKWDNPLMGWTSTGDPYAHVGDSSLLFDSKEDAIRFANKYGWEYTVREPHHPVIKPKAYADNFKFRGSPFMEED